LTRKQAASIASSEPHYLSYLFRRELGKTFVNWRREHRTSVALAALEEGKHSIDEIVSLVGYRSRRSLERAVKAATGRTAGSFKQKRRSVLEGAPFAGDKSKSPASVDSSLQSFSAAHTQYEE
jgi:methylphosphotriester-DNA--protein-cysteine methyltransferase